jgi:hypothetical protein
MSTQPARRLIFGVRGDIDSVTSVLEHLIFDVPYRSGLDAWTDLLAGGLFFCVVFRECLAFGTDGRVRRWREVVDENRALDNEGEEMRAGRSEGTYSVNERGYLVCSFTDSEMTGLPCQHDSTALVFHVFRRNAGMSGGIVYCRDQDGRDPAQF